MELHKVSIVGVRNPIPILRRALMVAHTSDVRVPVNLYCDWEPSTEYGGRVVV